MKDDARKAREEAVRRLRVVVERILAARERNARN
jgi:hypothetical protein